MARPAQHRARALLSSALDGVVVGAAQAALDHPRRSTARRRLYAGIATAVATDALAAELPTLQAVAAGRPPRPAHPEEQQLSVTAGLVAVGWGLTATVLDGPLARALARRGHDRPHLALGIGVGLLTAASTLPFWWRRSTVRIADDVTLAAEEADLAAWEAELAAADQH